MTRSLMTDLAAAFWRLFFRVPLLVLPVIAACAFLAWQSLGSLTFDASTDTLVAENDADLAYFEEISMQFGDDPQLFLAYAPADGSLFSPFSFAQLEEMQRRLEKIDGVSGVTSILDVPLLKSPKVELADLADGYFTLRSEGVELDSAKVEMTESPLYRELLISPDADATAIRISIKQDEQLNALRLERQRLRALENRSRSEEQTLAQLESDYQLQRKLYIADQERLMNEVRDVRDSVQDEATAFLAGVPLIASDMIRYVKSDIRNFGGLSIGVMLVALFVFFRRVSWVLLPVATALLAALITSGLLGVIGQPVTAISSNYVSLLIIFSIAITVHLIVRYRELADNGALETHQGILVQTMTDKFAPCVYTALTTMAAFASLMASDIVPVKDLGWIMCLAMVIAFVLNFTFFPAMLRLLPAATGSPARGGPPVLTGVTSRLSTRAPWAVVLLAILAAGASWVGMTRLSTDSRFIDYFRETSEIKQGLVFIDQKLGGTTPMEIILDVSPYVAETLDDEDDFFSGEPDPFPERYWYTPDKIAKLNALHAYLEGIPEVGKVISLATLEEMAREFNDGNALSTVQLAAAVGQLPEELQREFLEPYSSPALGLLRVSLRMRETAPRHSRTELINGIEEFAVEELGFEVENVHVTGVNVLFNNMLEVLYRSQVSTIGFVVLATLLMFLVLLRSPVLAIIGVLPNLLSATAVLGFMGFMGIALDMMTMTIAAIIIGIGVDNAIHYLHRYRQERAEGRTKREAISASHRNIGSAVYFTSITVVAGFSVLAFSNFVPTVYFGLLTALAMVLALIVNLAVLPSLLMIIGRDKAA